MTQLASTHYELGNYSKAENHFREAIKLMEQAYGKKYPPLHTAKINLAEVLQAKKKKAENNGSTQTK
jgi:hypothetical protein